jgi:hypothetical protein
LKQTQIVDFANPASGRSLLCYEQQAQGTASILLAALKLDGLELTHIAPYLGRIQPQLHRIAWCIQMHGEYHKLIGFSGAMIQLIPGSGARHHALIDLANPFDGLVNHLIWFGVKLSPVIHTLCCTTKL